MAAPVLHISCPLCGRAARAETLAAALAEEHLPVARAKHYRGGKGHGIEWSAPAPVDRADLELLLECAEGAVARLRAELGIADPVVAPAPEGDADEEDEEDEESIDARVAPSGEDYHDAPPDEDEDDDAIEDAGTFALDFERGEPVHMAQQALDWIDSAATDAERRQRRSVVEEMADSAAAESDDDPEIEASVLAFLDALDEEEDE